MCSSVTTATGGSCSPGASAGARDEPGAWDCGAGALEFGETFAQAVTREVDRGIRDPAGGSTCGASERAARDSHWVAVVFRVRVDPARVPIGEPHKFDELGWSAPDALPAPLHSQLPATLAL